MLITKAQAQKLLNRFAAHPGFPENSDAVNDLAEAFVRHSRNPDHAENIAQYLLDRRRFAPLPVDIREAAEATSPRARRCPLCADSGWIHQPDGSSRRCACTHDIETGPTMTPAAVAAYYTHRQNDCPEHPEVALGLPRRCATAKTLAVRQREAKELNYTGPLTLAQFVAAGKISERDATERIRAREEACREKFRVIEESRLKRKPAQSEIEAVLEQNS